MKRKSMVLLVILCAFFTLNMDPAPCVCDGESSNFDEYFTSFIACVFYGDCGSWYQLSTEEALLFTATGDNDGTTLKGSWKGISKQIYVILTFDEQGHFEITQHRNTDNYLLRYDKGTYTSDKNNLIMDMENGTYSIVQYAIANNTLTLSFQEEQESIETLE